LATVWPTARNGPACQLAPAGRDGRISAGCHGEGARLLTGGGGGIGVIGNFWQPTRIDRRSAGCAAVQQGAVRASRGHSRFRRSGSGDRGGQSPVFRAGWLGLYQVVSQRRFAYLAVAVGMLWVNTSATPSAELPFGGINDSGYGTEGGPEALENYLNTRVVVIANTYVCIPKLPLPGPSVTLPHRVPGMPQCQLAARSPAEKFALIPFTSLKKTSCHLR